MTLNPIKYELQNLLSGKGRVSEGDLIQAITSYLGPGPSSGAMAQRSQQDKHQETEKLISYINPNRLWVEDIHFSDFISSGAEQRVFIKDDQHVYKLNDTIYYTSWIDYFHNLLLNNFFSPDTAYQLIGFHIENKILYAVVEQLYVEANEPTDLELVREFMLNNGFENTRNHDYYNSELGIILEDLHDENVLTQNGMLYFIDTVFYIKPEILWN